MPLAEVREQRESPEVALAARALTKRFAHVVANDGITVEIRRGEIHGLVGENGSGKTTLCKLLTGLYQPDSGHVEVGGVPIAFRSPRDALAAGIFMVHQHFSLVERLTVAENVVLGWSRGRGRTLTRRALTREVDALSEQHGVKVDARIPVWRLSLGERQRVEILKALHRRASILILDEPTTVLTPQESTELMVTLRRLADEGTGVVFISHKLKEVLAASDRLTILRSGTVATTVDTRVEAQDVRTLVRAMVGRTVELGRRDSEADIESKPVVIDLEDVSADDDRGLPALRRATLTVRAGEVVGIAGVAGNGQRELAEVIAGLRPLRGGSVRIGGFEIGDGSSEVRLAYVPEDRFGVGLAPHMSVAENLILKNFASAPFSTRSFLRFGEIESAARRQIESFRIRATPAVRVSNLSGGNAQKVVLARELATTPVALVAANPTRGLDVGAIEQVRGIVAGVARLGTAVLLISEDLDELIDLSDRIAVMFDGSIVGITDRDGADIDQIGLMMVGVAG